MKIIEKYIFRLFVRNFFILVGIFSLVVVSSQLLHLPSFAYSMNILDFSKLLFLLDISFIKYQLLFGFFIGWLLVGIGIRERNEIYALFSAGISKQQLLKPVFITTVIFVLISFIFSLVIIPYANRERTKFLTYKVRDYILETISSKNFSKINEKITVYVEKKEGNNFYNVFIYNLSNGYLITAKEGNFFGNKLLLKNGYIQIPSENSFNTIKYEKYTFSIDVAYLKEIPIEDYKTSLLVKIFLNKDNGKEKVLPVLADRVFFFIPFVFLGYIGFLSGLMLYKSKESLLMHSISIAISYMILNYYFLKLIEKIPILFLVYPLVFVVFFLLVYKYQNSKSFI